MKDFATITPSPRTTRRSTSCSAPPKSQEAQLTLETPKQNSSDKGILHQKKAIDTPSSRQIAVLGSRVRSQVRADAACSKSRIKKNRNWRGRYRKL
jgi:hypothetical protein